MCIEYTFSLYILLHIKILLHTLSCLFLKLLNAFSVSLNVRTGLAKQGVGGGHCPPLLSNIHFLLNLKLLKSVFWMIGGQSQKKLFNFFYIYLFYKLYSTTNLTKSQHKERISLYKSKNCQIVNLEKNWKNLAIHAYRWRFWFVFRMCFKKSIKEQIHIEDSFI